MPSLHFDKCVVHCPAVLPLFQSALSLQHHQPTAPGQPTATTPPVAPAARPSALLDGWAPPTAPAAMAFGRRSSGTALSLQVSKAFGEGGVQGSNGLGSAVSSGSCARTEPWGLASLSKAIKAFFWDSQVTLAVAARLKDTLRST